MSTSALQVETLRQVGAGETHADYGHHQTGRAGAEQRQAAAGGGQTHQGEHRAPQAQAGQHPATGEECPAGRRVIC